MVISLLLTMGAYFLLMDRREASTIMVGTAILLSSKAFMDFSVSGLENPATNLGIAAFCWTYWRKREPLLLTMIASLTAVNRLDSFLLFLPALLLTYYKTGWKVWKAVLAGLTPLIAWEMFSLFYYGFPFPNTAYAKLGTGVSVQDSVHQGIRYLVNDYQWDKVTAGVIVVGFTLGIVAGEWPLSLGVLASVLYVIRVGGDFMCARFLCAPFVLACAIAVRHTRLRWQAALGLTAAILAVGLMNLRPTLTTTSNFGIGDPNTTMVDGITDERVFFYRATGILRWRPGLRWPDFPWSDIGDQFRESGQRVVALKPVGVIPYHAGPNVHVIDEGALGDALLARLPPESGDRRPGHYFRALPPGYYETVASGVNQIRDPQLAEYYGHMHDIVSGDLWSTRRMRERSSR